MRLPNSKDTRLLLAGVAAFLALVLYLAVAFASTHALAAPNVPTPSYPFAPWEPSQSKFALGSQAKGGGVLVHVSPGWKGDYGALIPTVVAYPPAPRTVVVSIWLRGSGPSPFAIEVDAFRAGTNQHLIQKTVPATAKWHRYTFRARVEGSWVGLGMYVNRYTDGVVGKSFAVRIPTVALRRR